jgi:hypothetical protein
MIHATRQADLFASEPDLFDGAPPRTTEPSTDVIRQRLDDLLATAREAEFMPWDARRTRVNELLFHQMANWLPEAERDALTSLANSIGCGRPIEMAWAFLALPEHAWRARPSAALYALHSLLPLEGAEPKAVTAVGGTPRPLATYAAASALSASIQISMSSWSDINQAHPTASGQPDRSCCRRSATPNRDRAPSAMVRRDRRSRPAVRRAVRARSRATC